MRRITIALVAAALFAAGCASSPESPWAADPELSTLPTSTPTSTSDDGGAEGTPRGGTGAADQIFERECFGEEVRCGLVAVPQVDGADDRVTVEFRVLAARGSGTPLIQLLDGSGEGTVSPDAFPDRPIVVIGSRGMYPGEPNLSCPEFYRATSNSEFGEMVAECADRLRLAGIDPVGTAPTTLGHDVAAVIRALGYDEVDLLVPSWRALTTPAIAARVGVRRVVYTSPWFAADRAIAPSTSALVSMDAVWAACSETPDCTAPGTVDDFLTAVVELDARPLDDVNDTISDEPRPIDADRLIGAVLSNGDRPSSLAFLPQLHQAILDRDDDTVSAFVQAAWSNSTEVTLLGVTCSLFDPVATTAVELPSPLREDAADGIEVFTHACAAWPSDDSVDNPPIAGLTVLTRSKPAGGADHAVAVDAGPVIVEPTIGVPTVECVFTAARAWFDRSEVDDSRCATPFRLSGRDDEISLIPGVYAIGDLTIELEVPSTWTDSGSGTWWRDADPIDDTNLDVYLWGAVSASVARSEVISEWGLGEAELSSIQVGRQIWLLATGTDTAGSTYQVAAADIDDANVALILKSDPDDSEHLGDEVLIPALATLQVS